MALHNTVVSGMFNGTITNIVSLRLNELFLFLKGIEFLPQIKIFWFQYLCNLMVQIFDISNLDYFIYKY